MSKILTRTTRPRLSLTRQCVRNGEIVSVELAIVALPVRPDRSERKFYLAGLI